jgi:hypothetical protein
MKKPQPKHPLSQLHLPFLGGAPIALPSGKYQQLVQALIELLLSGASESAEVPEGKHESKTDR